MSSCPSCSASIESGTRFCPRCGTALLVTCEACGAVGPAASRFCTQCGAVRGAGEAEPSAPAAATPAAEAPGAAPAAPPAAEPPTAESPAAKPPPPEAPSRGPGWALGTPPAHERWWRNPVVLVAALVTLVAGGGGVTTWRILAATESVSSSAPSVRHTTTTAPPPTNPQTEPNDAALATAVREVDRILVRSESGRVAVAQEHDFVAALRNRRALVAAVDRLDLPPEARDLAPAAALLRSALATSARADRAHLACGCQTKLPSDYAADRLKRRFVRRFNPFARRFLGHAIDPLRI